MVHQQAEQSYAALPDQSPSFDSSWEDTESYAQEKNTDVVAWDKNDHIGCTISCVYNGAVHSYLPDFLIKLSNGMTLVLETKG